MSRVSKNFHIYEFVPKEIYEVYGANSKWFVRPEVIKLAQFYRDWFEVPITINDWQSGGRFSERGYRVPNSKTGAVYSQHKLGSAFDCTVKGMTANEVRKEILDHEFAFMMAGLTTLEHEDYAPTWVHSDVRNTGLDYILIVKPATTVNLFGETIEFWEEFHFNCVTGKLQKN